MGFSNARKTAITRKAAGFYATAAELLVFELFFALQFQSHPQIPGIGDLQPRRRGLALYSCRDVLVIMFKANWRSPVLR